MIGELSVPIEGPLAGSLAKLARAKFHLDSLYEAIRPFLKSEPQPYRFVSKVDVETSRYLMRVVIEREPPIEWSLLAGDFVQNLRAALDHLVWQLVRANGQAPSNRTAFPIFNQPPPHKPGNRDFERWNAMTRGVHPNAIHFIEACQPYSGSDGPSRHLMSALRRMSNEDKHRTLLPAYSAIEDRPEAMEIEVVGVRDVAPVKGGKVHSGAALKSGDIVLEAPVEITGPNPEVKLNGELPLDVGFGWKPTPLKGLSQMGIAVETMLIMAADLFFGSRASTENDQV